MHETVTHEYLHSVTHKEWSAKDREELRTASGALALRSGRQLAEVDTATQDQVIDEVAARYGANLVSVLGQTVKTLQGQVDMQMSRQEIRAGLQEWFQGRLEWAAENALGYNNPHTEITARNQEVPSAIADKMGKTVTKMLGIETGASSSIPSLDDLIDHVETMANASRSSSGPSSPTQGSDGA